MNKSITLFIFILLAGRCSKAAVQFKDFIVTTNFIWGLTTTGTIKITNRSDGKPAKKEVINPSKVVVIAKDRLGRLVIADSNKRINYYNEQQNTWKPIATYTSSVFGLIFNSKNDCFAITDQGIEDVKTHQFYYSDKSVNNEIKYNGKWGSSFCHYIDRHDNIWVGFGHGEWGGDVFIFDTARKTFIIPTNSSNSEKEPLYVQPVKSFFEDTTSVYLTASLQHMMMTGGSIIKFTACKAIPFLKSESYWGKPVTDKVSGRQVQPLIDGEYIGPAAYNKYNNSIYFYSQHGFFRGNKTKDLTTMKNWELIINPKLQWKYGQSDAVGSPMNMLKMEILDRDTFIFVSQHNGIGYVKGKQLIILK